MDTLQTTQPPPDEAKLMAFLGRVVGDFGAAMSAALAHIGDKLGLYRAMAQAGPLTSAELAQRTGTAERYVREWLINQAAGGYIEYDPAAGRYHLPPEQAVALADEASPFFVGGGFQLVTALAKAEPRITEAFRTGEGMCWGEHDPELFEGTERFFRSSYLAHLVSDWIPALDGVETKLTAGAKVADVGCGHGASTIIMARAYPHSRFFGFDNHAPSIERARRAAAEAGVADRVTFEVAQATEFPGSDYDLIAFFDCLHDMGDPTGAARRACGALAPGGTAMIVEPMAGERTEENFNPVGRVYSAASVLCCTPNAICAGGPALGTVASDQALRDVVLAGGFTRFRRATQTPFNRVFEARA
ncbi:MAG: methyltransferase domain-containing protein [Armatimonadetes bacterium]|nr:methyltransferase domain-containing protein [Armatimonadota bacterium]